MSIPNVFMKLSSMMMQLTSKLFSSILEPYWSMIYPGDPYYKRSAQQRVAYQFPASTCFNRIIPRNIDPQKHFLLKPDPRVLQKIIASIFPGRRRSVQSIQPAAAVNSTCFPVCFPEFFYRHEIRNFEAGLEIQVKMLIKRMKRMMIANMIRVTWRRCRGRGIALFQ